MCSIAQPLEIRKIEEEHDTRTAYTYDNMYRVASAAVTTDSGAAMSVAYTYNANDYCLNSPNNFCDSSGYLPKNASIDTYMVFFGKGEVVSWGSQLHIPNERDVRTVSEAANAMYELIIEIAASELLMRD